MLPLLLSLLVLLGSVDVTSSQNSPVVQLTQVSGESTESAESVEDEILTTTTTVTTETTPPETAASDESEEQIASSEDDGMEPTPAPLTTDNRDRTVTTSTTNRPRAGEVVTTLPLTPLPMGTPLPLAPAQPAAWTQPATTWVQPASPPRVAGSCQANEHACPCIGGTYCLFRAAACLSPNIVCPSEVLGTPEIGSNADVMVQASWAAPASAVSFGNPISTPYVRPTMAAPVQFQQPASLPLYPVLPPMAQLPPAWSTASQWPAPATTFGPAVNSSQWPVAPQWPMSQPMTFGVPVAAQNFVRASPTVFPMQPIFNPLAFPQQMAPQPVFNFPQAIARPPNTTFFNSAVFPRPTFQSTFNTFPQAPLRPAVLPQPIFNSFPQTAFRPANATFGANVFTQASTTQPITVAQPVAQPVVAQPLRPVAQPVQG